MFQKMKNKKPITFLTIFFIVFFPTKLFADHQLWHMWLNSEIDWYLEPKLDETVFKLFERADLLFEDKTSKNAAQVFINTDFDKLSEYQMEYLKIRERCEDDNEIVSLNSYTNIENCVYDKDLNLLSKLELVLDTPRKRYEILFDRTSLFAQEYNVHKNKNKEFRDKLLNQYFRDKNRIIRDHNSAIVYELEEKLFSFFVKMSKENKGKENIEDNEKPTKASGTGFFISDEGHIVTNFHVIEGCNIIYVRPSWDKSLEFAYIPVIVKDQVNDLAVLKVHDSLVKENIKTIKFDKDDTKKGDEILVIGYPFGDDFGDEAKITKGIVSALQGIANDYSKIQIDAAIQPGNSGGPVLNQRGNLVGVAVATANIQAFIEDYGTIPQNMNFAVKSNILKMILEANEINFSFNDSNDLKTNSEIFQEADESVVLIDCYY